MKSLLFSAAIVLASQAMAEERPATKIVGGEDASRTYPWMAGLHLYLPEQDAYQVDPFCGGSLIAPGWVITAAHCITTPGNGADPLDYEQTAEATVARIGLPDLVDVPQYFVSNLFAHPRYGVADGSDDSDIALVQLARPANVETISLADNDIMNNVESSRILNDVVRIIGWGVFDDAKFDPDNAVAGNQPDYLQEADIDYLPFSNSLCRDAWGGLTGNMICAWEPTVDQATLPNGQDACFGDSGGPLMIPANTLLTSGRTDSDWLLGATSFGSTNCNSSQNPGVYTKLSRFSGWIENTSKNAGDPLVDVKVFLSMPAGINPDKDFNFVLTIRNVSINNNASTVIATVSANDSLLSTGSSDCILDGATWACTVPRSMPPGMSHKIQFEGSWQGMDEASLTANASVQAAQDDYRIANNSLSATTPVSASYVAKKNSGGGSIGLLWWAAPLFYRRRKLRNQSSN